MNVRGAECERVIKTEDSSTTILHRDVDDIAPQTLPIWFPKPGLQRDSAIDRRDRALVDPLPRGRA